MTTPEPLQAWQWITWPCAVGPERASVVVSDLDDAAGHDCESATVVSRARPGQGKASQALRLRWMRLGAAVAPAGTARRLREQTTVDRQAARGAPGMPVALIRRPTGSRQPCLRPMG